MELRHLNKDLLQESLEDLYENAPCGYILTLPDGTFAKVNRTFLDWVGYQRKDLLGSKRFQDLLTVGGKIFYETHYAPLLRMQGFVKEVAFDLVGSKGVTKTKNVDHALPAATIKRANTQSSRST